jgi:hypothetical protein
MNLVMRVAEANNLSDSLVSSQVYEIIKTIYSTPDSSTSTETRVSVLQNTLGQLRLANIATLDAITTHFTRLIELTSADEAFVASLAQVLAPCILRPRLESSLTMHERHAYRLVRDLFDHKEAIFGELKRASSQTHQMGALTQPRQRAPSNTDESNRRANMEARNRAIANKSRTASPAPAPHSNGIAHRRDRSVGRAETRFPIVASPTAIIHPSSRTARHQSLEVPDTPDTPRSAESQPSIASALDTPVKSVPEEPISNGTSGHSTPAASATITTVEDMPAAAPIGLDKHNSLGRSGHVAAAATRLNRRTPGSGSGSGFHVHSRSAALRRDSAGSMHSLGEQQAKPAAEGERTQGVQLTDKPMDF